MHQHMQYPSSFDAVEPKDDDSIILKFYSSNRFVTVAEILLCHNLHTLIYDEMKVTTFKYYYSLL